MGYYTPIAIPRILSGRLISVKLRFILYDYLCNNRILQKMQLLGMIF